MSHFNLFEDPTTSPNGTGRRQQYGLQVGGGSDVAQYYLSAEWEDETGYIRMPQVFRDRLLAERNISEIPEKQEYPNALTRTNLRGNLNAQLSDRLDVQLNGGFVSSVAAAAPDRQQHHGAALQRAGRPGASQQRRESGRRPRGRTSGGAASRRTSSCPRRCSRTSTAPS